MNKFLKENMWGWVIGLLVGALLADYIVYYKQKQRGYAKIAGIFKYTPGQDDTL